MPIVKFKRTTQGRNISLHLNSKAVPSERDCLYILTYR